MVEAVAAVEEYSLQRTSLAQVDDARLEEWESFRSRQSPDFPLHDPAWLRGYFAGQLDNLHAYLLYQSGSLRGVAPFLLKDWSLKWQLGEVTILQPPLQRLRLLGGTLNFPEDEAAYDMLFSDLATSGIGFDAIQLEEVPVDSFLWRYLQNSSMIRRSFRMYIPDPPTPHLQVRLKGSFDEYMKKFSAKSRSTLRRKVKRIREGALGPMRLVEYTKPEDVSVFLDAAVEVSKKTYQWTLLQKGLSRTELLKGRMAFAADRGWLRCYILFCNEMACAFFVGFQYEGAFLLHETGFDPALSKYSVGMVLQLLIIEDLFDHNTPGVFDLGTFADWKDALSNNNYSEARAMLFRRGAYTRAVQEGHHACQAVSRAGAAALDRMQLKNRLKRMIRGVSASRGADQNTAEPQSGD